MAARLIKAAENVFAAIARIFRWWFQQIARQGTLRAKIVVLCAGLLALCVVCSVPVALVNGPRKTAPAVASVPSTKPTTVEATAPTDAPTATQVPTELPTATTVPTEPPTATLVPTAEPTVAPKPTAEPIQNVAPPAPKAPIPTAVDVGAYPCQSGQIKGNRNSGIYHAPGQRDYAKTQANVECFDSEAAAQAAGYRRAKR